MQDCNIEIINRAFNGVCRVLDVERVFFFSEKIHVLS